MNQFVPTDAIGWLTLALVVITAFYAFATFKILKANRDAVQAMRDQTETLLRPYVSVEVTPRPGTTLMNFVVKNTGKSAAQGLRMSIDRPVRPRLTAGPKNLQELALFRDEAPTVLAAGAEIHYILGVGHDLLAGDPDGRLPDRFTVSAQYSFGEKGYVEQHIVDTTPLLHSSVQHDQVADAIERAAGKLAEAIGRLGQA